MVHMPAAADFPSFYDLGPTTQKKCIYPTKKGKRCGNNRSSQGEARVRELWNGFTTTVGTPELALLQEYARLNCCAARGNFAGHQRAIENNPPLLRLVAEKWTSEIQIRKETGGEISVAQNIIAGSKAPANAGVNVPEKTASHGVSRFPAFHELVPYGPRQCIYRKKDGERCDFESDEIAEAEYFYEQIIASEDLPELDLLLEYAWSNCCGPRKDGVGARHQDSLQDKRLLVPLAERWREEIRKQRASEQPVVAPREARYNLRSASNEQPKTPARRFGSDYSPSRLSTFRRHAEEPTKNVALRMKDPLIGRDFKSGCLYIFSRDLSPGYVKIGWTGRAVQKRLDEWEEDCGYKPRPEHNTDTVRYVQRAESLVHYELINEWRAERQCESAKCRKTHKEWFEVTVDRATEVVTGWAMVMECIQLYAEDGTILDSAKTMIDGMATDGVPVTAKALLERHSLLSKKRPAAPTVKELGESGHPPDAAIILPPRTPSLSAIPENPLELDLSTNSELREPPHASLDDSGIASTPDSLFFTEKDIAAKTSTRGEGKTREPELIKPVKLSLPLSPPLTPVRRLSSSPTPD
ncbi:T5orf172 domain-containing protein [Microdochium trichocladiopsis]|uniref:T5orf172 domain-containing protein n=1 Tax=Microdochium trichocladiopsis TaxID=1682393 RepID=A0A9P8YJK4_9PEZI|nr:T5orf172 domain-containing protein [Microdochium trichocladiopsis]KAH7041465.1 T5orf172 domain-containing protein [Microdochium trichocladiopsis]